MRVKKVIAVLSCIAVFSAFLSAGGFFAPAAALAQSLPGVPAGPANAAEPPPPPALPGETPAPPALPGAADGPNGATLPDITSGNLQGKEFEFEKTDEQQNAQLRKEAFSAALEGLLPLKPHEIRELLEHFDRTQESVETPVYPPPKPVVTVENVSLDPGAPPLTVKLAFGNVTTLSFLDITGAPWPIEDLSWAGPFEVVGAEAKQGAHLLRITPQTEFATGNLSLRLLTLQTPIILSLETNRDVVHYRFDAMVPEYGPFAKSPIIDKGISLAAGDADLSAILAGAIPPGAKKLNVAGVDGRTSAYNFKGMTYVRTPLTLLSPGWTNSVASGDGLRVYAMKNSPVLLLSDKGKMVRARLSERDNLLTEDANHGR